MRSARPRPLGVLAAALFAWLAALGASGGAAADPAPYGAPSCTQPVSGNVGQPIVLGPQAVVDDVVNAVNATPGEPGGTGFAVRFQFGLLPPFPVGQLPTTPTGLVSGAQVADAVVGQLPRVAALKPVSPAVAAAVHRAVAAHCGLTTHSVNAAPVQGGPTAGPGSGGAGPAAGSGHGGAGRLAGPSTPVGGIGPNLPLSLYQFGASPLAQPGADPRARYGSVPVGPVAGADTGRRTGKAVAVGFGGGAAGFPLLLAALALTGVTAALVRTFALRRLEPGRLEPGRLEPGRVPA